MTLQRTFAIIKPDAVKADHVEDIIEMIEDHGFDILAEEEHGTDQSRSAKILRSTQRTSVLW